jgi:hypothetical protein
MLINPTFSLTDAKSNMRYFTSGANGVIDRMFNWNSSFGRGRDHRGFGGFLDNGMVSMNMPS